MLMALCAGIEGVCLQVVEQIKQLFGVEAPFPFNEVPHIDFPEHEEPRLSIFCDSESTNASVR